MNREKEIYPLKKHHNEAKSEAKSTSGNCQSKAQPNSILAVKWAYRWEVFRRLKALGINCQCSTNEPLLVCLDSPNTVMQVWSVIRQFNASRSESIDWLDSCWRLKYKQ